MKSKFTKQFQIWENFQEMVQQLRKLKGKKKETFVLQEYIQNPLLTDQGNKIDFKVYAIIFSVEPMIVYLKKGFIRVNNNVYENNNFQNPKIHQCHTTFSFKNKQCEYLESDEFKIKYSFPGENKIHSIYDKIKAAVTYTMENFKITSRGKQNKG
jgi:hypothetical protein